MLFTLLSSKLTAVYNPRAFIPHAASLGQTFVHCRRFSTAATRRCLGSVSVPVSRAMLSHPVTIAALVSRYLTNKLIVCGPIPERNYTFDPKILFGITASFPTLSRTRGQVTTRYSPFRHCPKPKQAKVSSRTTCMPNPRRQRSF